MFVEYKLRLSRIYDVNKLKLFPDVSYVAKARVIKYKLFLINIFIGT